MKKALLVLGLLVMFGCEPYWETEMGKRELERRAHEKERLPMLRDGMIHIGMTDDEFARLWERPHDSWIDRSTSRYGIAEWWSFDYSCEPTRFAGYYNFHFENGILTYWSEN